MSEKVRRVAVYLPQFHPIPENNKWWGEGFTEWSNVVKGKPRFNDHYQPHLPAHLGFYDLRLQEARLAQERLAKDHNIHGFCYYHYWFNGHRLLNEPLDRKLSNESEDLPFMLCWANENWTRAWDGGNEKILIAQNYSEEDDKKHAKFLLNYFKDKRYIKVNGKPFFIFYKPDLFPNIKRTIEIFREEAAKENIELYLGWFERWIGWQGDGHDEIGFDSAIEFQPLSKSLNSFLKLPAKDIKSPIKNGFSNFKQNFLNKVTRKSTGKHLEISDLIVDYDSFMRYDSFFPKRNYKCFPSVCPMWDNSSRRVNRSAVIFKNSTPDLFKEWYHNKLNSFEPFSEDEDFLFINAWNEWAEGNHLEPCEKWGLQYLKALL